MQESPGALLSPPVNTAAMTTGSMLSNMNGNGSNGNGGAGATQQPSPSTGGGGPPPPATTEGTQQFCLRWNSYPATVATQLAALRAAEDFVDVTLACDGRQLRAHKLVLSACSPYFMQMFKSTPCKHPVIFLKDVGFRQLVALLEFMYAGEVNVSQAELPALLRTAEALQVRGLADTNPNNNNNNNFPLTSPLPKPPPMQQHQMPHQSEGDMMDPTSTGGSGGGETQQSNPPCDSSSNGINGGKRLLKNDGDEEEEDSADSHDFEMAAIEEHAKANAYLHDDGDGSLSQQFEDTGEVFPQNLDANSFGSAGHHNHHDLGGELLPEDEEGTDVEEDENSLDCAKDFPGFNSDGSYGSMGDHHHLGNTPNGGGPGMMAGPSGGNGEGFQGGNVDGGNLMKGEAGLLLPPGGPGEEGGVPSGGRGRGRNRLARSLWPPGIPYHGPQQCPYCPRKLSNVGNWRKHVLTMHFAREKVYKCHLCSSAFRTSEYLQKHYVRVHNYPQKMTRKKFAEQS